MQAEKYHKMQVEHERATVKHVKTRDVAKDFDEVLQQIEQGTSEELSKKEKISLEFLTYQISSIIKIT